MSWQSSARYDGVSPHNDCGTVPLHVTQPAPMCPQQMEDVTHPQSSALSLHPEVQIGYRKLLLTATGIREITSVSTHMTYTKPKSRENHGALTFQLEVQQWTKKG